PPPQPGHCPRAESGTASPGARCEVSVRTREASPAFHSLTLSSFVPIEARVDRSGERATDLTPRCPPLVQSRGGAPCASAADAGRRKEERTIDAAERKRMADPLMGTCHGTVAAPRPRLRSARYGLPGGARGVPPPAQEPADPPAEPVAAALLLREQRADPRVVARVDPGQVRGIGRAARLREARAPVQRLVPRVDDRVLRVPPRDLLAIPQRG